MSLRKTLCSLMLLLTTTGCYKYRLVERPRPGTDVRVRLTTEAAVRRSEGLADPVMFYAGRLMNDAPEAITLDVLVVRDPSQFRNVEIRDTVTIPRSELQSIMVRELSTSRSLVVAAAVGVGAFAIVKGITAVVGGTGDDDDPDPPTTAVVPLFAVRAGRGGFTLQTTFR